MNALIYIFAAIGVAAVVMGLLVLAWTVWQDYKYAKHFRDNDKWRGFGGMA